VIERIGVKSGFSYIRIGKSDGQVQIIRLWSADDDTGIPGRAVGAGDAGVCDPDIGRGSDGHGSFRGSIPE